jgi:hypothetical protein
MTLVVNKMSLTKDNKCNDTVPVNRLLVCAKGVELDFGIVDPR